MKNLGPWGLLLVGILGAGCSAEMLRFGTQDRLEIHVTPPPGFNGTAVQAPQTPEGSAVPRLILPGAATLTAELKAINGPFQQLKTYNLTPAGVTVSFEEVPVGNYTLEMQALDTNGILIGQANRKLELNSTNPPPTEIGLVPPYSGDIFVAGGPDLDTIHGLDSASLSEGQSITKAISTGGLRKGRLSLLVSSSNGTFFACLQNSNGKILTLDPAETSFLVEQTFTENEMIFLTVQNRNTGSVTVTAKINSNQNFVCFDGGDGLSATTPFLISDLAGLRRVGVLCNDQGTNNTDGKFFKLISDIDMAGISSWTPIGPATPIANHFKGTFDGDGRTIFNFNISASTNGFGLFGVIAGTVKNLNMNNASVVSTGNTNGILAATLQTGTLDNIRITNSSIQGQSPLGGLLGNSGGTSSISNCLVTNSSVISNVGGSTGTGGLVGRIDTAASSITITNSQANNVTVKAYRELGGLVGNITSPVTISGCRTSGSIYSEDLAGLNEEQAGGLVGHFNGNTGLGYISNSNSSAAVSLPSGYYVGGLVGQLDYVIISQSSASGSVTGLKECGGLVGLTGVTGSTKTTTIEKSFSTGAVTVTDIAGGGIVGTAYAGTLDLTDCYSRSNISGGDTGGGLVGWVQNTTNIKHSYAANQVTNDKIWGLSFPIPNVTSCFYDGNLNPNTVQGAYKKNTTELQTPGTFSGWDPAIWTFTAGSYPRLAWETP